VQEALDRQETEQLIAALSQQADETAQAIHQLQQQFQNVSLQEAPGGVFSDSGALNDERIQRALRSQQQRLFRIESRLRDLQVQREAPPRVTLVSLAESAAQTR